MGIQFACKTSFPVHIRYLDATVDRSYSAHCSVISRSLVTCS